jgi:hypothetical protein
MSKQEAISGTGNNQAMNVYTKAVSHLRKQGVNAFYKATKGAFIEVQGADKAFEIYLTHDQVQHWADEYDSDLLEDFKKSNPYEILQEIALIFHYLGWDLGENGSQDTSFIESSEKYLERVYNAFNPLKK